MSGTRLNTKVEDLASSLTVITKEQMSDFALLDLNDIFLYEAGHRGNRRFHRLLLRPKWSAGGQHAAEPWQRQPDSWCGPSEYRVGATYETERSCSH
jgi:hypothetical protein